MKAWKTSLICISLTLLCLFTSLGYASFSSVMKIAGSAKIEGPEGLFITSIKSIGSNNLDTNTATYVEHSTTVNAVLSRQNKGNQYYTTYSATYEITVLNNTNYEYAYRGLYYMNTYGSNSYVSDNKTASNKLGVVTTFNNASASVIFWALTRTWIASDI